VNGLFRQQLRRKRLVVVAVAVENYRATCAHDLGQIRLLDEVLLGCTRRDLRGSTIVLGRKPLSTSKSGQLLFSLSLSPPLLEPLLSLLKKMDCFLKNSRVYRKIDKREKGRS
jgi:hypothetical protein